MCIRDRLNSGRAYPYGFGWFIGEAGGQVVQEHGGAWQGFITQYTRFADDDLAVVVLSNARTLAPPTLAMEVAALFNPRLAPVPAPVTPIADRDTAGTAYVRGILAKGAGGELEMADFEVVRQTIFPRIRAALVGTCLLYTSLLQPESTNGLANLAMGVTTVRDPQVTPEIFGLADIIEVDQVPSPRLLSTGPGVFFSTNFQSYDEALRTLSLIHI